MRHVIRCDGRIEQLDKAVSISEAQNLIGADCLDVVNLQGGMVMLVDDDGINKGLPINKEATKLYWHIRVPNNFIYGDVVIVPDNDYRSDEK